MTREILLASGITILLILGACVHHRDAAPPVYPPAWPTASHSNIIPLLHGLDRCATLDGTRWIIFHQRNDGNCYMDDAGRDDGYMSHQVIIAAPPQETK